MPVLQPKNKMKVVKAKSTLGKPPKKGTSLFTSLKGINQKEKAIRVNYAANRYEDGSVKKIKAVMVVVPLLMVAALIGGVLLAVNEYKKQNPPPDTWEKVTSSENLGIDPADSSALSEVLDKLVTVVNPTYPIADTYQAELVEYGGVKIDKSAQDSLKRMIDDAKAAGYDLVVTKGYVSVADQEKQYRDKVAQLKKEKKYSDVRAESEAKMLVAPGGQSEFQTGLLIAVQNKSSEKDEEFEQSDAYAWLTAKSIDYGFVLRYPKNKTTQTGAEYSATTYRFVGQEHAKQMRSLDMCLDEYSSYISRQP